MPLEKKPSEWRARVEEPGKFEWMKQIWPAKPTKDDGNYPYNKEGIRAIGGALKSNPDQITEQSIRFSTEDKYSWSEDKIKTWITDHGFDLKSLKVVVPKSFESFKGRTSNMIYRIVKEMAPKVDEYVEGKDLIIEGIISSESVDTYEEIVLPDAIIESIDFYMKFPTVRYMHQANPIGKTLKIWKVNQTVRAQMQIDATEIDIIKKIISGTLRAFSIGFMVKKVEQYCPEKDKCYWRYTKIRLVEISVVDSPANRDAEIEGAQWKGLIDALKPKFTDDYGTYKYSTENVSSKDEDDAEDEEEEVMLVIKGCTGPPIKKQEIKAQPETVDGININTKPLNNLPANKEVVKILSENDNKTQAPSPVDDAQKKVTEMQAKIAEQEQTLAKFKAAEDERKKAEEIATVIKTTADPLNAKIKELEAKIVELENEKKVREQVDAAAKNAPPKKKSLSNEDDATTPKSDEFAHMNVSDKKKEAYRKMSKTLARYSRKPSS
ncbi:HK97 family phage prohead protease [Sulfuricurvum sp.]|uniref:HK97 family phage prohead protease n=1 Tax=Sulfuricurvum sp. TaxID=2025608 RepID=UPI003563424B